MNYVLRAINIKGGKHKVVLEFKPTSVKTTEAIAYAALAIIVLTIILSCVIMVRNEKKKQVSDDVKE